MALRSNPAVHLTLLLASTCFVLFVVEGLAEAPNKDSLRPAIYDKDSNHLWNRLHAALFVRIGPDGNVYGQDRLEPLLWDRSQYLLKGKQAALATAVLEEFVRDKGESLIDDPLKRAILQRDLWLVANWASGRPDTESQKLFELLAQVIDRVALSTDQIAQLPDNFALAVASKKYAAKFDGQKPQQAYLPSDLFQSDSPWVCVGRTDGRTAPAHLGGSSNLLPEAGQNRFTNSTFLVFVRLPAGREAGLTFLKQLARQKQPIFIVRQDDDTGRFVSTANRDLPPLPLGSELALVRRAMLIDTQGRIVASHLVESVQLRRVMSTKIPDQDHGGVAENPKHATVQEFELGRADLFAHRAGGLRDVSEEHDFVTGFRVRPPDDEFEVDRRGTADRFALQPFRLPAETRRETCYGCHATSNFYDTRSFQRPYTINEELNERSPAMYPVIATEVVEVEKSAVKWKASQPGWLELQRRLRK